MNKNWSPEGLLLFQILVSFSLLKVTFDGLLDTFPPCPSFLLQFLKICSLLLKNGWILLLQVMSITFGINSYINTMPCYATVYWVNNRGWMKISMSCMMFYELNWILTSIQFNNSLLMMDKICNRSNDTNILYNCWKWWLWRTILIYRKIQVNF